MSKKATKKDNFSWLPKNIVLVWFALIVSVGILMLLGQLVVSDIESYQACNGNGIGSISNCGKVSLTAFDVIMVILFILSAYVVVKLGTYILQTSRSKHD